MKRRLSNAPKLPDPKLNLIRVGDMVKVLRSERRMIVIGFAGSKAVHLQAVEDGALSVEFKRLLEHVVEDGRVLTHRDIG